MKGRSVPLIALVLFVGVVLGSLFFLVHPWYDRTNDGSTYLITARSIAGGTGYTYLEFPFHIRPPGFSTLIAPLVGVEGKHFGGLNLLVSLFGAAGVILLHFHLRARLGWELSLLTATAVWFNPGYQRLCNQVMSDVPGLTLLLGCLLLERWASRRPCWRREVVLGLAIGLAAYLRSITILLIPALILARLSSPDENDKSRASDARHRLGRIAIVAACAWLVLLPWSMSKILDPSPAPADQTLNYSLSTAMWHMDPGDPASPRYSVAEVMARVPPRLMDIAQVLGSRLQHRIPGSPQPGSAVRWGRGLVALLLVGCLLIQLVRRRTPAEWFALGVLFVISIYFIFTDRLALPVYVFALAATVEVLRDLSRRVGARAALIVPALVLLLLIVVDFKPRHGWDEIEARHRAFGDLAQSVDAVLQPQARLGAGQGFHYGVYLERPVYSLTHAARRAGRLEAAERIIDRYELNTIVLSTLVPADRPFVPYFTRRYGPGEPAGPALVWRVRP